MSTPVSSPPSGNGPVFRRKVTPRLIAAAVLTLLTLSIGVYKWQTSAAEKALAEGRNNNNNQSFKEPPREIADDVKMNYPSAVAAAKAGQAVEAKSFLTRYLNASEIKHRKEATRLLEELGKATSDGEALQTLVKLSKLDYDTFVTSDRAPRAELFPNSLECWKATLRRNLLVAHSFRERQHLEEMTAATKKKAELDEEKKIKADLNITQKADVQRIALLTASHQTFKQKAQLWKQKYETLNNTAKRESGTIVANLNANASELRTESLLVNENPPRIKSRLLYNDYVRHVELAQQRLERANQDRAVLIAAYAELKRRFVNEAMRLAEDVRTVALQEQSKESGYAAFWISFYDHLVMYENYYKDEAGISKLEDARRRCNEEYRNVIKNSVDSGIERENATSAFIEEL